MPLTFKKVFINRILPKFSLLGRHGPSPTRPLQEILQNADDAGARRVVFLYDDATYGTEGLWSRALADGQGPALYAYNDAVFQAEDWTNIQNPEQSGKLEDATKIGRFGLGFISVYHLTGQFTVLPWHSTAARCSQKVSTASPSI